MLLYLTICDEDMEAEDTEFISCIILSNKPTHRHISQVRKAFSQLHYTSLYETFPSHISIGKAALCHKKFFLKEHQRRTEHG